VQPSKIKLVLPRGRSPVDFLGERDEFLRLVESAFDATVVVRGNELTVAGDPEETRVVADLFRELIALVEGGQTLTRESVGEAIRMAKGEKGEGGNIKVREVFSDTILVHRGRPIYPKTLGQKRYVDAIRRHTVVFAIGPAGTGKTYLAMAMAVRSLQEREVSRIILVRPAVEAGERLGFLPGTLYEKIDPYLKPLWDALYDMMEPEQIQRLMERGTIEVAPLAYMRGRTLNDSFIILDEAQNTTPEQMKMFLTRLGFGSRVVVTGDITQIDLPAGQVSGLNVVREILTGIEGLTFVYLTSADVVRHKIVQDIVEAYRRFEERVQR
jgi:phosphate starvation-inducible PhoH-like protein